MENWFKYIKSDLKIPRHARPHVFVTNLRAAIESTLKEQQFPVSRKKKTKRTKKESDASLNTKEEVWKPVRKGTYHITPKTKKLGVKKIDKKFDKLPRVMRWGGKLGSIVLANTCTIDNVLTILHIQYCADQQFKNILQQDRNPLSETLLTVFKLMSDEQFPEAKLVWVNYTRKQIKPSLNLYGDKYDFIVAYISNQLTSQTISTCDNPSCSESRKESKQTSGMITGYVL